MNTTIATAVDGKMWNSDGQELTHCKLCEYQLTTHTVLERCQRCWDLEIAIRANPALARKVLDLMTAEQRGWPERAQDVERRRHHWLKELIHSNEGIGSGR